VVVVERAAVEFATVAVARGGERVGGAGATGYGVWNAEAEREPEDARAWGGGVAG
jgi:hypothetical protein